MKTALRLLVLGVVLLYLEPARGDYVRVSRSAHVRAAPDKNAQSLIRAEPEAEFRLIDDEQTDGYYHIACAESPDGGWIYRTFVRRYAGEPGGGGAPTAPVSATAHNHLALGKPIAVHEIEREAYVTAVDARLKIPVWVQYELRKEDLTDEVKRGDRDFRIDSPLPLQARPQASDYTNSGYVRGHMAPAEDMRRSENVMADSFYFSNCAPQIGPTFNGAVWKQLEGAVRVWVERRGALTIITGPIFLPEPLDRPDGKGPSGNVCYLVIGENHVAVPTHFYKIVVDATLPDDLQALAFVMPNTDLKGHKFDEYLCTIRDVECMTGLDFLAALPDPVENRLETTKPDAPWPTK